MGNPKNKESDSGTTEAGAESTTKNARDAHHASQDLSQEREAKDTTLAKQVAEAIAREMTKAHVHYQALLNERDTAAMPTSLKMTSRALGFLRLWTPLTGQRTKLSTRDGNCGQKKLDTPLKQWKVIQKRLKFHISTTGLTVKEWPRLSHGRIARHSLARRTMKNLMKIKKKASTL